jgi:hypothetical protein
VQIVVRSTADEALQRKEFLPNTKVVRVPNFSAAEQPHNSAKNFPSGVLPYDRTRVVLSSLPALPGSNYINANFVKVRQMLGRAAWPSLRLTSTGASPVAVHLHPALPGAGLQQGPRVHRMPAAVLFYRGLFLENGLGAALQCDRAPKPRQGGRVNWYWTRGLHAGPQRQSGVRVHPMYPRGGRSLWPLRPDGQRSSSAALTSLDLCLAFRARKRMPG